MTVWQRWRGAFNFDEPRFLASQVALIHRNLPLAMLASALVGAIMSAMHYYMSRDPYVLGWGVCAILVSVLGWRIGQRRLVPGHELQMQRQARLLQAGAVLLGGTWGALAWFFMRTEVPHTTNLVLGATAGLNSGGMVLFAPSWPLSVAYLLTTIPPAIISLLASPNPHDQTLGVAVLIYLVVMLVFSYHAARAVRESIELRFENADLVGRLRDQTQRAFNARQVAEEALIEAETANRAKVVFMAAASHDLRQPLHALGLFASTLRRTYLSPQQRGLLDQVDHSAEAARDMLGTLLDFSKVDAGVVTPHPQPFALQPMLHHLEQEFAPQAAALGLVYRTHDTKAVVVADAALVERILRNLISNALRYTERGGVLVGVRRRGVLAVVEVWDTGVGIEAGQHEAIFREFHQLGNPERDRRKGLGLGLAIVEGLARAMSVSVTLASVPGRGSVFRLTLPLSQEAVLDMARPFPEGSDLAGARVLVIDDDEGVRAAMAELLTSWGAWCEVVESADDALALMARFTPQVIVADYRLRGHRHGREAIEMVRAQAGQEIPAVLVTGDTAADRLREAQASGLPLLHKPVPSAQLHEALLELLRGDVLSNRQWGATGVGPASAAD